MPDHTLFPRHSIPLESAQILRQRRGFEYCFKFRVRLEGKTMDYLETERKLSNYFKGRSVSLLRYAMGIIFFWYGALKVSGDSPVDERVMQALPWVKDHIFVSMIGIWEMAIGLFLFF